MTNAPVEDRQTRLKRLAMRSMRRGIKEMDLILPAYFSARSADMTPAELDLYEQMLEESDHDLYAWVSGHTVPDPAYADMIADVRAVFDAQR